MGPQNKSDDGTAVGLEIFIEFLNLGHLFDTGTAGCGPDVDHGHLVLIFSPPE